MYPPQWRFLRQTSETVSPSPLIRREVQAAATGRGEVGRVRRGGCQAREFVIKINYSVRQNGDIRRTATTAAVPAK